MRYWYEFLFSGNDEGIFPRMVTAYFRLGLINTNFDALQVWTFILLLKKF